MDVVAHVEESEFIRSSTADRVGTGLPAVGIIGECFGRVVAPRKQSAFAVSARGTFLFGFRRKPESAPGFCAEPLAVADRLEP